MSICVVQRNFQLFMSKLTSKPPPPFPKDFNFYCLFLAIREKSPLRGSRTRGQTLPNAEEEGTKRSTRSAKTKGDIKGKQLRSKTSPCFLAHHHNFTILIVFRSCIGLENQFYLTVVHYVNANREWRSIFYSSPNEMTTSGRLVV